MAQSTKSTTEENLKLIRTKKGAKDYPDCEKAMEELYSLLNRGVPFAISNISSLANSRINSGWFTRVELADKVVSILTKHQAFSMRLCLLALDLSNDSKISTFLKIIKL